MKLYDPDRFTTAKHNLQNDKRSNHETVHVKWEDLDKAVIDQLKKGKVAVLTSTVHSPSTAALLEEFTAACGGKTYVYDDLSYADLAAAQKASYGNETLSNYHLDKAKYIVAINNDFLGTWLTPVKFNRQFAIGRRAGENMNKLVVFESLLTLTGSNADQRFRVRPSQSLASPPTNTCFMSCPVSLKIKANSVSVFLKSPVSCGKTAVSPLFWPVACRQKPKMPSSCKRQ
jgi:anaerobic selenocysteine-containing dehydrogenase